MEIKVEEIRNNQIHLLSKSQKLLEKCEIEMVKEPLYIDSTQLVENDKDNLKSVLTGYFKGLTGNIIYTVSLEVPHSCEDLQGLFRLYKAKKQHAMSKVNDQRELKKILYVGSSKGTNLKTRIYNHFGVGSKRVFSMHLIHWLPETFNSRIKVQLYKVKVPEHSTKNINLVELMEQGFWDELKPMFGKRSGLL